MAEDICWPLISSPWPYGMRTFKTTLQLYRNMLRMRENVVRHMDRRSCFNVAVVCVKETMEHIVAECWRVERQIKRHAWLTELSKWKKSWWLVCGLRIMYIVELWHKRIHFLIVQLCGSVVNMKFNQVTLQSL